MAGTITLSAPFDMSAVDFAALQDGTDTFTSATEVDITATDGEKFVFTGTGFGDYYRGLPIDGEATSFTVDGKVTATFDPASAVYIYSAGWFASNLAGGTVNGSSGDDTLVSYENTAYGNDGNDVIQALYVGSVLVGGRGDDTYEGYSGGSSDTVVSYAGATAAVHVNLSLTGAQAVGAGLGNDTFVDIPNLTGSAFNDRLAGDAHDNIIDGGGGHDALSGGIGNDTIVAYDLTDSVNGGPGFDTLKFVLSPGQTIDGANYRGIEDIQGTSGGDTMTSALAGQTLEGLAGNDTLTGNNRADTLEGGAGNDLLNGGGGYDTASYANETKPVHVDLTINGAQDIGASAGTDTLVSIENLTGTFYADVLTGNAGKNYLQGGFGRDVLNGGGGNDTLDGGPSGDTLTGGAGADTFAFTPNNINGSDASGGKNPDLVTDFISGQDHLHFAVAGVTILPVGVDFVTTGTVNSATYHNDIDTAVGSIAAQHAVLFTPDAGDLAGTIYLIVNATGAAQSNIGNDIMIQIGAADSNLTGFGTGDFI